MLWIFLLLQRTAQAVLPGFVWKHNRCERCQCEYFYRLERIGKGKHTAYGGDQIAAQRAADWAARANLDRKLQMDADAVPCPDCAWYQQPMVRAMRDRRFPAPGSTMWTLCILFGSILLLAGVITFAAMSQDESRSYNTYSSSYSSGPTHGSRVPPPRDDTDPVVKWGVSLVLGLAGIGLGLLPFIRSSTQRRKREGFDPNRPGAPAEDWQAPPALRRPDFEQFMAQEQAAQQAAWQQWQAQQAWQQQYAAPAYPYPQQGFPVGAPRR